MSQIDEIKSRLDIVDLVTETVQLRRSGKNYVGFCPFHSNTRTPAFVVFPESGTWRCFGQCNEGGDIFRFVMKKEGWDFSEALRSLAEKAGVQLRLPTPQEQEQADAHERLRNLLEAAATFYRHHLLNTPAGAQSLDYLRRRGLGETVIEAFGLGYAPDTWEAASGHFREKGYSPEELIAAGLVTQNERGDIYDRFRRRIVFPIRDERGRMAGFGGRVLDPNDIPKFINSPQTAVFDKSGLLYGLDNARRAIRSLDQAVIVEGYLDVIALHQAGYANAVSPMGTALSEAQLRLLKRFTRRIVLALDADAAGDKATLRGLQVARQALEHTSEPVFDARGLLSHEARLQADIRVATLPAGLDPDDVVLRDPAEWERLIAEARPVVIHVMEVLAAGRDLEDAKVKPEIAAQVLPLIREVPDPLERETYRQRLARLLRVDESMLQVETGPAPPRRRRKERSSLESLAPPPALSVSSRQPLEEHCLGLLLRRPDLVYRVDRALQEEGLQRLAGGDFERVEHQMIFQVIQESLTQDLTEPLNYALNSLSLPLMEQADRLLARTGKLDAKPEVNEARLLEDLLRALLELRRRALRQNMEHVRYLMEEAPQESGPADAQVGEYLQTMVQYAELLKRIHHALGRYTTRLGAAA
jgi:DNA primase